MTKATVDSWRFFQLMGRREKVEFSTYIEHIMATYPHCELHVGCDSQNYPGHTVYVTAIVFRHPGAGAHIIYRKERVDRITDLWTKLWGETERSVAIASAIRDECGRVVRQIDLDYNADPEYASNKLLSASTGYITSLGFTAKAKPNLLMAAWAANMLCHC